MTEKRRKSLWELCKLVLSHYGDCLATVSQLHGTAVRRFRWSIGSGNSRHRRTFDTSNPAIRDWQWEDESWAVVTDSRKNCSVRWDRWMLSSTYSWCGPDSLTVCFNHYSIQSTLSFVQIRRVSYPCHYLLLSLKNNKCSLHDDNINWFSINFHFKNTTTNLSPALYSFILQYPNWYSN